MKTVALPSGETVPALGMGTWRMGDDPGLRAEEIATLRLGLDLGLSVIDTAEMYGDGTSEELVGEAVKGRREAAFLVSKVYPHNASRQGTVEACEASLKRLGTDRLDLYLLHWRGRIPLTETVEAFLALKRDGKIRAFGVSNFDVRSMEDLVGIPGGSEAAANQVLYNLVRRGIEWDLLPWLRTKRIPMMAYSPVEEGELAGTPELMGFAAARGMTPAQVAIAWLLRHDDVMVIPKTSRTTRLKENAAALTYELSAADLTELDQLFPPPSRKRGLDML